MIARPLASVLGAVLVAAAVAGLAFASAAAVEDGRQERPMSREHSVLILAFPELERGERVGVHIEGRGVDIGDRVGERMVRYELRPGGYEVSVTMDGQTGTLLVRLDGVHRYDVTADDDGVHFERTRARHAEGEAPPARR